MDRRKFLKTAGVGAVALSAMSCLPGNIKKKKSEKKGEMAHHLGSDISLLGYGCMRWPMIENENGEKVIDQAAVDEMVDYAMAHGVNYFDSAPVYLKGQSEAATGKSLSRYPRESYYIATKMSNYRIGNDFEAGKAMYQRSLEYFNTDYIDYYLLHNIPSIKAFNARFLENGLLDYLLEERRNGHIRNLGFSVHCDPETFDYIMSLHEKYHWDFAQIQMNYIDWTHATEEETNAEYMYKVLDGKEIPVIVMEPLLGGRLADVPSVIADDLLSKEPEKSIASWAFRFCGSFPRVLTVLSGMTCMDHLKDNLDTFIDFKDLSGKEIEMLEDAAVKMKEFPIVPCTGCNYCMPCTYGIDIPGLFDFYNESILDGTYVETDEQKDHAMRRRRYLLKYNRAIPTVRQADHCIQCKQCVKDCPQHIDIPGKLSLIDEYVESLKRQS